MAKILIIAEPGTRFFSGPMTHALERAGHTLVRVEALMRDQMDEVTQRLTNNQEGFDAVLMTGLAAIDINDQIGGESTEFAQKIAANGKPVIVYDSISRELQTELRDAGLTVMNNLESSPAKLVAAVQDVLAPRKEGWARK